MALARQRGVSKEGGIEHRKPLPELEQDEQGQREQTARAKSDRMRGDVQP